jgi:hypothetical protein
MQSLLTLELLIPPCLLACQVVSLTQNKTPWDLKTDDFHSCSFSITFISLGFPAAAMVPQ